MLADWLLRLRSIVRRQVVERELDEELRFHLERLADRYVQTGLSRDAAERRARIEFGGPDQIKEEHRDARGVRALGEIARDLRYTVRQLKRSPRFTVVALLAIALGVGATTTVFTIVNAVLVRSLPFEDAGQLYHVAKVSSSGTDQWLSIPEFTRWQQQSQVGVRLAAFTPMDFNIRGSHPEGVIAVWASKNFLPVLRTRPALGRPFAASDFNPESERTALISHALWQRRYGGDPAIVGSPLDLEGPGFLSDSDGRYTIIGVLPETFWLFYPRTDVVLPMRASTTQMRDHASELIETVIARVAEAHPRALRSDLGAISRRYDRDLAGPKTQPASIDVVPLRDWHFGDLRRPLLFLMGAALLVALTACANAAVVTVARTIDRRRELAIRVAVGASRGQVIRQLVIESVVLSLLGGLVGLCLASGAIEVASGLIPRHVVSRIPGGIQALSVDRLVLFVVVVASVLSGLLSGLGSLFAFRLRGAFVDVRGAAPSTLTAYRQPFQAMLVIVQASVAVILLVCGGLLLRSLERMNRVDLGIEPRPGLVVWLNLNQSRYPLAADRVRFYQAVLDELDRQPEVTHVSGIDLPFHFEWQTVRIAVSELATAGPDAWPEVLGRSVSPTYFERHGIRLLHGRLFDERDDPSASPVVIVSERLAERHWPGRSPIGQTLRIGNGSNPVASSVVGVVADIRSAPYADAQAIVYRPFQQSPPPWMYVLVEGVSAQQELLAAIRRAVRAVDPDQALDGPSGPWTLQRWISARTEQPRMLAAIAGTLAASAVLLATIGLYGLLSYTVARRTAEFGVRVALGAGRRTIMVMVLRRSLMLTGVGVAIGLAAATVITRWTGSLLFGVTPLDPATFAVAGLTFVVVATLASIAPARRAMAVNPVVALAGE